MGWLTELISDGVEAGNRSLIEAIEAADAANMYEVGIKWLGPDGEKPWPGFEDGKRWVKMPIIPKVGDTIGLYVNPDFQAQEIDSYGNVVRSLFTVIERTIGELFVELGVKGGEK